MDIALYQVDAFASEVFKGNPAAVCPLDRWLDDATMQAVAFENNLSETAFFVSEADGFRIRWFTPLAEVALCGHATLASAHVLFTEIPGSRDTVTFSSLSGLLRVERRRDLLAMNFPSQPPVPADPPRLLFEALGGNPVAYLQGADHLVVYESEEEIAALTPRMDLLMQTGLRGVIVTAPGRSCDFVSRFFAPGLGIDEDPVTGSAHCELVPYWSRRLGRTELHAVQVSRRMGELFCVDLGDRVEISGRAVTYLRGTVSLP
ncbi:MAG TPA: PhzF family phenazine biosynthesis protein [Deltaproteobacteria bacterium]|nr:PhzF family phenazine biosynthesis protein [Deltaproteobacteria bacterium]